jgi:hypothetical protein
VSVWLLSRPRRPHLFLKYSVFFLSLLHSLRYFLFITDKQKCWAHYSLSVDSLSSGLYTPLKLQSKWCTVLFLSLIKVFYVQFYLFIYLFVQISSSTHCSQSPQSVFLPHNERPTGLAPIQYHWQDYSLYISIFLLLPWHYSPGWALASFTMCPHSSFPRLIWRFRDNNSFLVWGRQPYVQPPTWRTRPLYYLYLAEAGWPSYTPRHRVPILVASYDTHELRWDYSYSPFTTRGIFQSLHLLYETRYQGLFPWR